MVTAVQGYRLNAGIVVINDDKQILLCERKDVKGAWQMPQGGIEDGETPVSAGLRELYEETGIRANPEDVLAETKDWLFYDFPPDTLAWRDNYKGQQQKWILVRFKGSDKDINLSAVDEEFAAWKWASDTEVTESIVPFKRPVYERVIREFADFLH